MVTIIEPSIASPKTLKPLSKISSSSHHSAKSQKNDFCNYYKIRYLYDGETTLLLFASQLVSHEKVVIKILKKYEDTRYHMATVNERRQCQLEALKQNRRFTPDVYIGLARLNYFDLHEKEVCLGEIINEPDSGALDTNAEYVLMMHWLPESERLDCLLNTKQLSDLKQHMNLLSEVIAKIHNADVHKEELSLTGSSWGTCDQLQQKLEHNFAFFERVLKEAEKGSPDNFIYVQDMLSRIKVILPKVFQQEQFKSYFEGRIYKQRILRCHGDLKAANIWILSPEKQQGQRNPARVKILDAIDFNSVYCNVDILSDMAMLAVDIEARTSRRIAQIFIRKYLRATKQNDRAARAVLAYYLAERAMIGAIVYIGYDKLPEIGLQYLQVAETHMLELQRLEHTMQLKSIVKDMPGKHIIQRFIALQEWIKRFIHTSGHSSKVVAAWAAIPIMFILAHFAFHRSSSNHSG